MGVKGNKFGAFKGVFTPSILTILGVIMYLRLPWIIGQAGLWATLGIILVAHIISVTTGLSVASIATDKKVETGGTYYMISRSLGLPIGGTLGLALFVGLSFSISLYIIGFSETLLTAFGLEVTLNTIRLTGALTLLVVTIVSFISTNLALKTQFIILGIMVLSIASILLGKHEFVPNTPLSGSAVNSLPWIALFAIFFPAVQGFEAGVSMSGDLANPKKAIPIGTISAILVGFVAYIGLVFFFSYTVERDALLNDSSILLNISLYSPLVIAGIWGATLSSAFGGLLGAPRILQATAMDRITPKVFAKGVGAGNEPRNALLLTFVIAFAGIMIGELNTIARVVSTFFIITYGFLNLTCAIENWAGTDFRPSFRIPAWVSIIGSIACFVIMIQLDLAAMIGATIILGAIFFFLKRRELKLQSGDTWGGIWSSLVKYGLAKLSVSSTKNQRNWSPNVILFSGSPKARPHLLDLGKIIVGKQGVFTNFELVQKSSDSSGSELLSKVYVDADDSGEKIITRRYPCNDIYEGMQTISKVYGFTGFEPNTILQGWARNAGDVQKLHHTAGVLHKSDYNLVYYNRVVDSNEKAKGKHIDLWWGGNSRNLNFALGLLKFITIDTKWRGATVHLNIINYNSAKTDSIYALANQALDNSRLIGRVKVINNSVEKLAEYDIIKSESATSSLAILELNYRKYTNSTDWFNYVNTITNLPCSSMLIEAGNNFEHIDANTVVEHREQKMVDEASVEKVRIDQRISYPSKELLANTLQKTAKYFTDLQETFVTNSVYELSSQTTSFHDNILGICNRLFAVIKEGNVVVDQETAYRSLSDFAFQCKSKINDFIEKDLVDGEKTLSNGLSVYQDKANEYFGKMPDKMMVAFAKSEFKAKKGDSFRVRSLKFNARFKGRFLGWPVNVRVGIAKTTELFLKENRLEHFSKFYNNLGVLTFRHLTNVRKVVFDLSTDVEQLIDSKEGAANNFEGFTFEIQLQLSEALNEYNIAYAELVNELDLSLERSLQQLIFVVDKPESKHLLRFYQKQIRKRKVSESDIQRAPELWHENIRLYSNKILTELILHSFRLRLHVKIGRQVEELSIWIKNNILKSIGDARNILDAFAKDDVELDYDVLSNQIEVVKTLYVQDKFEVFFKEINAIIIDLPELVEVNDDQFFNDLERGQFIESGIRAINFRRKVQLYLGTEFINQTRLAMEKLAEALTETSKLLRDKVRLAAFNMQNLSITVADEHDKVLTIAEVRSKLVNELLIEIKHKEDGIRSHMQTIEPELHSYLIKSFEPLKQEIHSVVVNDSKSKRKNKRATRFGWYNKSMVAVSKFLNKQFVGLIYSQSEGLLLAQKITTFEKGHKTNNQLVQEVLISMSHNAEVLKKVPFYYANLFSRSTTLNKDLWIERPYEQRVAETVAKRCSAGYAGALLITGRRNSGKTTLSKHIAKKYFPKHIAVSVKAPLAGSVNIDDFTGALQKALATGGNPSLYLNATPKPTVIIINDLELWWARHPEGMLVINHIADLVKTNAGKVFFIINCGDLAYKLINRVANLDSIFMASIECQPFDAKGIKDLVMARHQTGGMSLVLNDKREADLTQWNFARLFNLYFNITDGIPGLALQLWLANITKVVGKTIYISPPTMPSLSSLRSIDEKLWMYILHLILHRRTDISRLATTLRLTPDQAQQLISDLKRSGLVEERFPNVFAVNSVLEPFLVSIMQEKGLC